MLKELPLFKKKTSTQKKLLTEKSATLEPSPALLRELQQIRKGTASAPSAAGTAQLFRGITKFLLGQDLHHPPLPKTEESWPSLGKAGGGTSDHEAHMSEGVTAVTTTWLLKDTKLCL